MKKGLRLYNAETLDFIGGTYWIRTSDLMRVKHAL